MDFRTGSSNYSQETYLDRSGDNIHIKLSKCFKNIFHVKNFSFETKRLHILYI